jgi:signal transduction histidine kinase
LNPLPQYVLGDEIRWPRDGWLIETPGFCKRADHNVCASFYVSISLRKGLHQCPFGYACYSAGDSKTFISALCVKKKSDPKKLTNRTHPAFYPEFTESDVLAILTRYDKVAEPYKKIGQTLPTLRQDIELAKRGAEESMNLAQTIAHEIRNFNRDIKSSAEEVLWQVDSNPHPAIPTIQEKGQTIFALSSLISVRLSALDFDNNPESIVSGGTTEQRLHSKFYKARQCLTEWAYRNGEKRIDLDGSCYKPVSLYQIFDLIPFLVLENAIKYGPFGEVILVTFYQDGNGSHVRISSYGPPVDADELKVLGLSTFRTRAAKEYVKPGTGLGLKLVRKIANLHNMGVEFKCEGPVRQIEGKKFMKFIVELHY